MRERRIILAAVALLLLAGIVTVVGSVCDWPTTGAAGGAKLIAETE